MPMRSDCTCAVLVPVSRAISPGCGVNIALSARRSHQRGICASVFSPSASTTVGGRRLPEYSIPSMNVRVSAACPIPHPISMLLYPSKASSTSLAADGFAIPGDDSASGRYVGSIALPATAACIDAGSAIVTSPLPVRVAALPARYAAPM